MYPKLLELGPISIYTYGVLLAAAYLIGLRYAIVRARARGMDADRVMPGDGVIPLTDFLTSLDRAGYRGPAEVELFNPKYRSLDPLEAATEARKKAEQAIQTAFS